VIQDRDEMNLSAGRGVAIREFKLEHGFGFADYLLFIDGRALLLKKTQSMLPVRLCQKAIKKFPSLPYSMEAT
jgi:hypothetical protein